MAIWDAVSMHIILGYFKGEAFVEGHTSSRAKADRFVEKYPHGRVDEYDYVEVQSSRVL